MAKFAPKIFNIHIFNDDNVVMQRMKNPPGDDTAESEALWDDVIDEPISVFDYILAQKLDLLPFDASEIYWDWTSYHLMSSQAVRDLINRLDVSVRHLVNSTPVHEDIFWSFGTLDYPRSFYPALFHEPEPYKILCMQWDSYYELYILYARYTERRCGASSVIALGPYEYTAVPQYISCDLKCGDEDDTHRTTCNQKPDLISMGKPISDQADSEVICFAFTSQIGQIDVANGDVCGPYESAYRAYQATCARSMPAIYPVIRVSKSFFSDLYGC